MDHANDASSLYYSADDKLLQRGMVRIFNFSKLSLRALLTLYDQSASDPGLGFYFKILFRFGVMSAFLVTNVSFEFRISVKPGFHYPS